MEQTAERRHGERGGFSPCLRWDGESIKPSFQCLNLPVHSRYPGFAVRTFSFMKPYWINNQALRFIPEMCTHSYRAIRRDRRQNLPTDFESNEVELARQEHSPRSG
jgi:hypothetical protein